ncbi:uncharacterized protein DKFZp434B061-like [Phyllostomus hastatus]|uniref:uncharacterized protein DKFZp434B061-like n=1 Tax=Phyllostomus hastatus TaxID=9423 RepID=UPI001E67F7DB|nr:uncharacterized protein DKFZp434B061-like [Phyllostomus hastatus]
MLLARVTVSLSAVLGPPALAVSEAVTATARRQSRQLWPTEDCMASASSEPPWPGNPGSSRPGAHGKAVSAVHAADWSPRDLETSGPRALPLRGELTTGTHLGRVACVRVSRRRRRCGFSSPLTETGPSSTNLCRARAGTCSDSKGGTPPFPLPLLGPGRAQATWLTPRTAPRQKDPSCPCDPVPWPREPTASCHPRRSLGARPGAGLLEADPQPTFDTSLLLSRASSGDPETPPRLGPGTSPSRGQGAAPRCGVGTGTAASDPRTVGSSEATASRLLRLQRPHADCTLFSPHGAPAQGSAAQQQQLAGHEGTDTRPAHDVTAESSLHVVAGETASSQKSVLRLASPGSQSRTTQAGPAVRSLGLRSHALAVGVTGCSPAPALRPRSEVVEVNVPSEQATVRLMRPPVNMSMSVAPLLWTHRLNDRMGRRSGLPSLPPPRNALVLGGKSAGGTGYIRPRGNRRVLRLSPGADLMAEFLG